MEIITNPDSFFWNGRKVLITGHTGFKGSWLCMYLHSLGADITGFALEPPTDPNLFELCRIHEIVCSTIADIRDLETLTSTIKNGEPEIVFHLAAQPIVRESYLKPVETYETNVLGTVNLLEAIRRTGSVRAVVNITTDKCYDNKERSQGYRETEPLGGYDPYSSSKACSELVTSAYRNSFFPAKEYAQHRVAIASARAGNVIGGGDWASDRLIPDFIRGIFNNKRVIIRNPLAIRPWQHVLEPLTGYILLAEHLFKDGPSFGEAWNFGPSDEDAKTVEWVIGYLCKNWENARFEIKADPALHEAHYLKLDSTKAKFRLNFWPRWNLETALDTILSFNRYYIEHKDMRSVCTGQISQFLKSNQSGHAK